MPRRITRFTVKSEPVQGPDSFVTYKPVRYRETKNLMARMAEIAQMDVTDHQKTALRTEINERLIIDHVVAWNWVGDDDQPLPPPSENPEVIDELTMDEIAFLGNALNGEVEKKE